MAEHCIRSRMRQRIATYGPKNGQCNICGVFGALTEDHTPPKGWQRPTQVELRHIAGHLGSEKPKGGMRSSQNGIKYRTLCSDCNNKLLGAKYDPHLISFANEVGLYLRSPMLLPAEVVIEVRPQPLMRSVLGHIAAQGVGRYQKGPLTEAFREYILDENLPLPDGLNIFYWAYPYKPTILIRDASYVHLPKGQNSILLWILKAFPLAFLVTWDRPDGLEHVPHCLAPWRKVDFQEIVKLPLKLRPLVPAYWPEAPTKSTLLAYGREAIYGTTK